MRRYERSVEEITDILDSALESGKAFWAIEVGSRNARKSKLEQAIREARDTRNFLDSRGDYNPTVLSTLISLGFGLTSAKDRKKLTSQLDRIYAAEMNIDLLRYTINKINRLESHLVFSKNERELIESSKYLDFVTHVRSRSSKIIDLNQETQGKIPEEYFSQMLGMVFPDAIILPRVQYNCVGARTLRFENGELDTKPSEVDILLIDDPNTIFRNAPLLEQPPYNLENLLLTKNLI